MKQIFNIFWIVGIVIIVLNSWSCKHNPILPMDDDMMPIDTIPDDTIPDGVLCDPDIVYFNKDVLPILNSNCSFSGCHDVITAEKDVILDSYENVIATADIEPFDLDNSKIYRMLTDNEEEDRMPPLPANRLGQEQIQIIAKWILQGAENLECDPALSECDTINVSFATDVKPLIVNHCQGCHSGSVPSGGLDMTTYNGIKGVADNGKLVSVISWEQGFPQMPQGGNQLPDCQISKIRSWVADGAMDN